MKKFTVLRFNKKGEKLQSIKVKDGIFIEEDSQEEFDKKLLQNVKNKEQDIKDRYIWYPGTRIPHIYLMQLKKIDKYNYIGGAPSPWTKPENIQINEQLLNTENIYEKLEQAKKDGNRELIEFFSQPLVSWRCPITLTKKALYAQAKTISNRNSKSDFIIDNLDRFEEAIKKIINIYLIERINTVNGMSAMINILSSKLQFRVGNNEKNDKTGTGITTFKPKHLKIIDNEIEFNFIGKKHVKWRRKFFIKDEIDMLLYNDLKELYNRQTEWLFEINNKRINSNDANKLIRKCFGATNDEEKYLSFHAYRHRTASILFKKHTESQEFELMLLKKIEKIEKSKIKNKDLKKAKIIGKELMIICKKYVAPALNDTPGVVFKTYAGGKIFKNMYNKFNIEYDEKNRTFVKGQFNDETENGLE